MTTPELDQQRIMRKFSSFQSTPTLFSKSVKTTAISPLEDKSGKTRSISPMEKQKSCAQARAGGRSLSPVRGPGTNNKDEKANVGKFLAAFSKPMSDFSTHHDESSQQDSAGPVPDNLRKAMSHFFINEQMQTHGSKTFFEYRSNIQQPGAKMFIELGERHLFVSQADDITRPVYRIHILELSVVMRPERLKGVYINTYVARNLYV